jgi:hypothetical protein
MKVLIDECMPGRDVSRMLVGHECQTVGKTGFSGKKNGALLGLAEKAGFDVILTVDDNLSYQQNLTGRRVALHVIRSKSNRIEDIALHIPGVLPAFRSIKPGQVVRV